MFIPPTFNPSDSSVAYQNRKKKYVYMVEYKDSWYNSSTQIHTVGYQKFVSCWGSYKERVIFNASKLIAKENVVYTAYI